MTGQANPRQSTSQFAWYGACLKHGRYLWHPHGRTCPTCGRPSARYEVAK